MELETLTVVFKGIGMILTISGGILIGYYGFRLYKNGVGAGRDHAVFEVGPVSIKAYSVGSVVMATAFLWAWAGVALSPNIEKDNDRIHVYSFHAANYKVETEPLLTKIPMSEWNVNKDPQQVALIFRDAIYKHPSGQRNKLELNDKPARYDPNSIKVDQTQNGKYLITAKVESGSAWTSLGFETSNISGRLAFIPKCVKNAAYSNTDPNKPSNSYFQKQDFK
jgi:hypothetical protein